MSPTMKDLADALIMHASKVEADLEVALARIAKLEAENGDLLDTIDLLRETRVAS